MIDSKNMTVKEMLAYFLAFLSMSACATTSQPESITVYYDSKEGRLVGLKCKGSVGYDAVECPDSRTLEVIDVAKK